MAVAVMAGVVETRDIRSAMIYAKQGLVAKLM